MFTVSHFNTEKHPLSRVCGLKWCTFGNRKHHASIMAGAVNFCYRHLWKQCMSSFIIANCSCCMLLLHCVFMSFMVYLWEDWFKYRLGWGVCVPSLTASVVESLYRWNTPWLRPDVGCLGTEGWGSKKRMHKGSQEPTQCVISGCKCILISSHKLSHKVF